MMKDHSSDLFWFLASHRFLFTLLYILFFIAFVGFAAYFGFGPVVELFVGLFKMVAGHEEPFKMFFEMAEENYLDSEMGPYRSYFLVPYILFHFFIVWGIGKIYVTKPSGGKIKKGLAFFFISLGLALLTFCILWSSTDFIDHDEKLSKLIKNDVSPETLALTVLIAGWGVWILVGWRLYKSDREGRGLIRFFELLFKGSWIQFVIVLPLYIGIQQKDDCPCLTASFLTLTMSIPFLLAIIGPGLYLLYLKEKELASLDPSRPRKILATKSRWF